MRETILLYTSIKEPVDALTDEQAGKLFKAILSYQAGEPVTLDGLLNVVFIQIKQQIDRNNEKYVETCKKRSDAGKKGMQSRWGNRITNVNDVITNDNIVKSVITGDNKNNLYDNDNDNDNDNDKDTTTTKAEEVAGLYNSICRSLPKVKKLSDRRRQAVVDCLKKYSISDMTEVFKKAERSDFLKGKNPRRWNTDFDWLISDANIPKVLEGKYDNKGGRYSDDIIDELIGI